MPNWVDNSFSVVGEPHEIAKFRERIFDFKSEFLDGEDATDRFTFHAFITPPADRLEELAVSSQATPDSTGITSTLVNGAPNGMPAMLTFILIASWRLL